MTSVEGMLLTKPRAAKLRIVKPTPIIADDLIVVAAFRYALGRMTYMVDHVGSWLIRNRDAIGDADAALIVREIDEADGRNWLGHDCDKATWMRVREAFSGRAALAKAMGESATDA